MSAINEKNDKKSTTIEQFDDDWKFLLVTKGSFDEDVLSIDYDDQHWKTIELPHHDQSKNDSSIFYYRKRFDWIYAFDLQKHMYLHFTTTESGESLENTIEIPGIIIWCNQRRIFEGILGNQSIDITNDVQINAENILILCSTEGYSLSLYARLIIPCLRTVHINANELELTNAKPHQYRSLDYTASFNEISGLIDVTIDCYDTIDYDEFPQSEEIEFECISNDDIVRAKKALEMGPIPRLAIVMLIVGTRGDVQPFIALAKALLRYGHRVRLATHETFRSFVREHGLEFYPLAGNPADLMSFMVKNAGIIPSVSSIIAGDISKNRRIISEILQSTWKACTDVDDETKVPFVAEAIIANPPSYGHIHCAQKLQIPLHIMFTMPWSPTNAFPHPLCRISSNYGPIELINRLSYTAMETLMWSGMGDLINEFREETLHLPGLHNRQAIRMMIDEHVPHTYCWSPSLVPKPSDWPDYLDVCGFFFLDLATNYQPSEDLLHFLHAGDRPIYIGFGSITGHDSSRLLKIVLDALKVTGYRALLSGLANVNDFLPENVFRIGNCPHDWLFQHVSAVCHHGGAGTTAAGLRAGKPTIIVPFFGDQFFWGSMINQSGAGPSPIPGKDLTSHDLIEAFKFIHQNDVCEAAERLRLAFDHENGCERAVQSFHSRLPLHKMQSDLHSAFGACFYLKDYSLQVSRPVAQVLLAAEKIKESQLTLHSTYSWHRLKNDDRLSLLFHNFMRHEQKALRALFIDTPEALKRASSPKHFREGARDSGEYIMKGIGHASIGCLAFYGDITDTLERLPNVYHCYSYAEQHERPQVNNLQSGMKAAGHSLWFGFRDGITGLVKNPQVGYQHDGIRGVATGTALAIPNLVLKPIAGTLASITWLSRGVYAEAIQLSEQKKNKRDIQLKLNSSDELRRSMIDLTDATSPEARASSESGLTIDICRTILGAFEGIQTERNKMNKSSKETISRKRVERQRSHSTTAL
ncbi:unnamed protein product [Didymodactylos carnosus]|uniref:Glycosyltransferase family 28 N-terminal domain-containing protein n=1 Tax=Didymodactylos carnosus TaxID=1234261 RepID=A0A815FFL5_9BILA|nr:unnamed protein product [Didymodactylos carnosus]CAF1324635.1 unnamed protein product [Didymodactylos carnosus]CAF4016233.1 unnamed protein product [Didymodactylos carnosus]CAF4173462.1 unnamed protein product [Didymodactylos carnosus]